MSPPNSSRSRSAAAKAASSPQPSNSTAHAVRIGLRRRQRLGLPYDSPEHVFTVECGCLTLDALLSENRRQVALILYAGDMISRSAAPPIAQVGLTAMLPSMLARLRFDEIQAGNEHAIADAMSIATSTARLAARSALHTIAIGRLSGEERVATLFLELALYLGKPTPAGHSFEIPLSRNDMADYMALNPDTLSRLVSRLRASGLITMPTRSRATVRDLAALEALTPLAQAMRRLRHDAMTTTTGDILPAP
jgi:CRP-like cAMP-binding protein